jgi:hypothetical protein
MDDKKIKDLVRSRYGQIVNNTSCCGGGCCSSSDIRFTMNEDYSNLKGYESIADFGLGCGLPTEFASLREGILSLTWDRAREMIVLSPGVYWKERSRDRHRFYPGNDR